MLITLGMLLDWATLPMLVMWPVMAVLYYRLARREEREMQVQFGEAYSRYLQQTSMFIPLPKLEKRVI
jgi:protein-S-isoprenylcysteine O-methyltransferase Ste14